MSGRCIAVVGLGLIGGSLARAISEGTQWRVLGADRDHAVVAAARGDGAIAGTADSFEDCDVIAIALRPGAAMDWLRANVHRIPPRAIVFDCCGVKAEICALGFSLAAEHGFIFFGGHPMAGTERSGYAASRPDLFSGASMLIVPPPPSPRCEAALGVLKALLTSIGFAMVRLTTPHEHDAMIAYTSQLAHIVSGAYVKSPSALRHAGFSAGSFRDMTRVAYLDPDMWTELFMANRAPLMRELRLLIGSLESYGAALAAGDAGALRALLADGRERKLRADANERST